MLGCTADDDCRRTLTPSSHALLLFGWRFPPLFMFVGTLIAIPIILVRLPADYFDIRIPASLDGEPPSGPASHGTYS